MFSLKRLTSLALIACVCLISVSNSFALPINSDVGLTPHKDEFIFRMQSRYTLKGDDPTSQDREVRALAIPMVGVYGFTSKVSMLVKALYLDKELSSNNNSDRGDSGIGDTTVLGKVRVYTKNYKGATSRLSLIGGLELPTGDDDERDSLGLLPASLQLGSGSVDVIAGAAYTYQTLDFEVDADLRYIFNQEANDFEFGDVFKYNLSYQKRIFPTILPDEGLYNQWNALIELNGIYSQRSESFGSTVGASGGHTVYLSPGTQFVSQRGIIEASIQLPVIQDLNGNQVEADYTLVLSFRYQF
jgi:hypothetical protein